MRSLPLSHCLISLFALAIFVGSLYAYGGISGYGAGFMPTVLSGLLLIFTLVDGAIRYAQSAKDQRQFFATEIRAILGVTVLITLFVLLIDTLGFILCATGLVFVLTIVRRPKKVLSSLMFAIIAALIINYLFADLLMVALPQGIWG
jgi:hypothetical protein